MDESFYLKYIDTGDGMTIIYIIIAFLGVAVFFSGIGDAFKGKIFQGAITLMFGASIAILGCLYAFDNLKNENSKKQEDLKKIEQCNAVSKQSDGIIDIDFFKSKQLNCKDGTIISVSSSEYEEVNVPEIKIQKEGVELIAYYSTPIVMFVIFIFLIYKVFIYRDYLD